MITAKILAFAGSARQDSFNKKLVKIAVEGVKGADATYLDFRDLPLPLYDVDLRRLRGCQRMPSSSRPWWKRIRDSSLPAQNTTVRSPHCWKCDRLGIAFWTRWTPIGLFQRKDCGVNECFSWKFGRPLFIHHSWQHWGSVARME